MSREANTANEAIKMGVLSKPAFAGATVVAVLKVRPTPAQEDSETNRDRKKGRKNSEETQRVVSLNLIAGSRGVEKQLKALAAEGARVKVTGVVKGNTMTVSKVLETSPEKAKRKDGS